MKMSEDRSVAKYLNEFNTIICQLSLVCINFDEVRALVLLSSLLEG